MAKKASQSSPQERPVVVFTERRAVLFGYATDTSGDVIELKRVRNCLYWSRDCKGFIGLAVTGPTKSCRIGPAAPSGRFPGVTAVLEPTPEAVAAWEAAPWAT